MERQTSPATSHRLQSDAQHIYSISELTSDIKVMLEDRYPFIWISGEISNFKKAVSGHAYFILKDEKAQISAVVFRGQQRNLNFDPEDGQRVYGFGRISLYEPRGTYQIILEYLEVRGAGALLMAFEKLKAKLKDEGLFDDGRKKPLPLLPGKVAVITSSSGAVVRDIIDVACRRFPNAEIQVLPVRVQGDDADKEIIQAIEAANERVDARLIILARGGGSVEDLAVFNSEDLARAIFASKLPVVSAIGHETDFTIADFVADLRAPTPSAAAELVFPEKDLLISRVEQLAGRLYNRLKSTIEQRKARISDVAGRMVHPRKRLDDLALRSDELVSRLNGAMWRFVRLNEERRQVWNERLSLYRPMDQLEIVKEKLVRYKVNILKCMENYTDKKKRKLQRYSSNLSALSPLGVLQRGYSITRREGDGQIIRDAADVKMNEAVEILVAKGRLIANVRETHVCPTNTHEHGINSGEYTDGKADV